MIRRVVLASILFVFSVATQAGEGFFWVRGQAWEIFSNVEKQVYVSGAMDGLIVASPEVREEYLPLNLSAQQYVDGLDHLYRDSRNTFIPTFFLISIVGLDVQGADANIIEEQLRQLRSANAPQN